MGEEVQGNLSHGPAETENPNRNNDYEEVRGNLSHDLPGTVWCMKSVPEHRDASSSSHESPPEPRVKVVSCRHSIFTHFLKDRNCEICFRTKITRASCRKRTGTVVPRAEIFGDLITADHKVLSGGCESRINHRYAVVVQDSATLWIQSHRCKTQTSQETQKSLQKFLESTRKPKVIYTGNSLKFGNSCGDLSWNHCTSTPHSPETNVIAGRAVRRIKEGTSAVLFQSGLDEKWWADFKDIYCYLRNIQDLSFLMGRHLAIGGSEYHLMARLSHLVHWLSITLFLRRTSQDCINSVQKSSQKMWKGDILFADIEELEQMDATEIYSTGLNAKEVLTPMSCEKFIHILNRRWNSLTLWRRLSSENIHPDPGSPRPRRRTR